jgi:hypothetical protein
MSWWLSIGPGYSSSDRGCLGFATVVETEDVALDLCDMGAGTENSCK